MGHKGNLSRNDKLNLLQGGGSAIELLKSRSYKIASMADLLRVEDDYKHGRLSNVPVFVESNGELFSVDEYPDSQPAGITDLMGVINEFETAVIYSETFFVAFMKH